MTSSLDTAAQRYAKACEETEHWRVYGTYPNAEWSGAWKERQAALSGLMAAAEALATRPTRPAPPPSSGEV